MEHGDEEKQLIGALVHRRASRRLLAAAGAVAPDTHRSAAAAPADAAGDRTATASATTPVDNCRRANDFRSQRRSARHRRRRLGSRCDTDDDRDGVRRRRAGQRRTVANPRPGGRRTRDGIGDACAVDPDLDGAGSHATTAREARATRTWPTPTATARRRLRQRRRRGRLQRTGPTTDRAPTTGTRPTGRRRPMAPRAIRETSRRRRGTATGPHRPALGLADGGHARLPSWAGRCALRCAATKRCAATRRELIADARRWRRGSATLAGRGHDVRVPALRGPQEAAAGSRRCGRAPAAPAADGAGNAVNPTRPLKLRR